MGKFKLVIPVLVVLLLYGYMYLQPSSEHVDENQIIRTDVFQHKSIEIQWLVCSGFRIKDLDTGIVVYTDPYEIYKLNSALGQPLEEADYIFISHTNHIDHFSRPNVLKLSSENTVLILPSYATGLQNLPVKEVHNGSPGESFDFDEIRFEVVPMYNVNKRRSNGVLFHPPEENHIGAVIEIGGVRIYFAASTDHIPEMNDIQADIVLLPVGGYAFMTPNEAASAVESMSEKYPVKYAIPMHYEYLPNFLGPVAAETFAEKVNSSVVILEMGLDD